MSWTTLGPPVACDRFSKLAPINDGAGDVNFIWRVDDMAPNRVCDKDPLHAVDSIGNP